MHLLALAALFFAVGFCAISLASNSPTQALYDEIMHLIVEPPPEQVSPALPTLSEEFRLPLASFVTEFHAATADGPDLHIYALGLLAIHVYCWLTALLAMPCLPTARRPSQRFWHCFKLSLWSVNLWPLAALAALAALLTITDTPAELSNVLKNWLPLFLLIVLAWTTVVAILSTTRIPLTEPASRLRIRPRCAQCGYILTGLAEASDCPECGLSVCTSIPGRRPQPPWMSKGNPLARFYTMVFHVVCDKHYARRFDMLSGNHPALCFAVLVAGLPVLVAAIFSAFMYFNDPLRHAPHVSEAISEEIGSLLVVSIGLGLLIFDSVLAATMTTTRCCGRSPRAALNVAAYASALTIPVLLTPLLIPGMCSIWSSSWTNGPAQALGVSPATLVFLASVALTIPSMLWFLLRLRTAFRDVRHLEVDSCEQT